MSQPAPELRRLERGPVVIGPGHWSARRINRLLAAYPAPHSYLEIGLSMGLTFERVSAQVRWGVDPSPRFDTEFLPAGVQIFVKSSDHFFETTRPATRFDVVYIDGLHQFRQVYRDLLNSIAHLAPRGSVLIDDTVPCDEVSAIPDQRRSLMRRAELGCAGTPWHGDVWKAVVAIAQLHPELDFRTIIGSGNPQTLVWYAPESAPAPRAATDADLARIAALEYESVLGAGVPELFRPCSEDAALAMRG
jgi:hypothetical protein